MAFLNQVYPIIYEKGQSISDHHDSVKGYESYKDFVADSFRERLETFDDIIKQKDESQINYPEAPCPTIYTYKGTESTGASTCNLGTYGHTLHFDNLIVSGDTTKKKADNYKKFGFEAYFGEYTASEEDDIETFTIKKMLKACGIESEEYIKKFIEANTELEKSYHEKVKKASSSASETTTSST